MSAEPGANDAAGGPAQPLGIRRPGLPARRIDARGRARVDARAIVALALPLFVNSSLQAVLNLTDTWFIGRISAQAVAGVGGVYWVVLGTLLLLGGVGMVVQAFAAQAYGAGRLRRAAQAAWSGGRTGPRSSRRSASGCRSGCRSPSTCSGSPRSRRC